jgi:hypothetical protein
MRHHDITDPIDLIHLKTAWYRHLVGHLVKACDPANLLPLLADLRASRFQIAITFIPFLQDEHPLYTNLAGTFIGRAVLEKLDLYDEVLRPSPARVEMGQIDDAGLFYHPETNEYEVSVSSIGVRFPALYVPVLGPDIADAEYAAHLAIAISSSCKNPPSPIAIKTRFPFPRCDQPSFWAEKAHKNRKNRNRISTH